MSERFADDRSTAKVSTSVQPEQGAPRQDLVLPTLTILSHPDLRRIGERVGLGELVGGSRAELSREQPGFRAPGSRRPRRSLHDRFLSRAPLYLEPQASGDLILRTDGSPTSVRLDGRPTSDGATIPADAFDRGVLLELAGRVILLLHRGRTVEGDPELDDDGLIGFSMAMEEVRAAISRVAGLDVPVLVRGETGTGKELVARALHRHSERARGPFVSVNLGTLVPSLAVTELFGARKGAYTGAVRDQPGFFGRAEHGTLFLDEVGEAPVEVQAMLLRALETGEIVPVGGQQTRRVDVRILSASDADFDRMIATGAFLAPLFHRLAGYTVTLPPLRERRDDLGRLLVEFLRREYEEIGEPMPEAVPDARHPWLPAAVVSRLALYPWPGNVRQLRNAVRHLVIDNRGRSVLAWSRQLDEILPLPSADTLSEAAEPPAFEPRRRKPSDVTEDELVESLRATRWNLTEAARALGISRPSLYGLFERSPRLRTAADVPPAEIRAAWDRHDGDLDAMVDELEISKRGLRQRLKDLGLKYGT